MRTLLLSAAAGTALAALAPAVWIGIQRSQPRAGSLDGAFDPLAISTSLCGGDGGGRARPGPLVSAAAAYAQDVDIDDPEMEPLWTGLGSSTMAITTESATAKAYFDQGLRLMHNFNHGEAVLSFRQAQAIDPSCAMCVWGEALSLGPNINAAMSPGDYARAHEAAARAVELADANGSEKERALARALTARYTPEAPDDRSALDAAWADAVAAVADQYPDDDEIQAMAAEAIMDTQPWSYWEADGRTPRGRTAEAVARIETVLARNPSHAPSIHLYIHLTEASDDPWRAADDADRLLTLAPAAGHLVHMPSHTYYRIGRFKDSLQSNIDAVAADESILAETGENATYRFGYYPHNIHMALVSAQMAGDAATALLMADKLDAALPAEMVAVAPWVQPIKAAPLYARAQFADPDAVLALPDPGADAPPYLQAAWRYARGEALAKLGRATEALDEAAAIGVLKETADFSGLEAGGVPAADVLEIMALIVRARAAQASGDDAAAVDLFQQATDLQSTLGYMEPPWWWYPTRQSLAAALLRAGQPERAEIEFYRTLVESPDNGWAYWGLAQARRARGDRSGARDAERKWRDAWAGERGEMSLERL
jgi:tetratricopeptide (TPR) repeat protein